MKIAALALLAIIAASGLYFIYEREAEKQRIETARREAQESAEAAQVLKRAAESAQERQIWDAIKEKKVIRGMTKAQVEQVWNQPINGKETGREIEWELRRKGIYEIWHYHSHIDVCFDENGVVLFRTEGR